MITQSAAKDFETQSIISGRMEQAINKWDSIYQGRPDWTDNDDIESFGFAKYLANYTARLTTLALGIQIEGSKRAEYLQTQIDKYISQMIEEQCEKACAYGHIAIKPNGNGIDYVLPMNYVPTSINDDLKIDGAIFADYAHDPKDEWYYTRLEWQRFEHRVPLNSDKKLYVITNKVFKAVGPNGKGTLISIDESPWAGMDEETTIEIEFPLFAIFKMPTANNIDLNSHIGCSIYSNAIQELKNLDIAHTRLSNEIFDSQKKIFMGDMIVAEPGTPVKKSFGGMLKDKMGRILPRYVHVLPGTERGDEYHETTPSIQTDARVAAINHWLNMVGIKVGYSSGQFVFNGRTGQVTATQVESDDRETIQLIKQIRDAFKCATDDLIKALDGFASLYDLAPVGVYETTYDFGDITYNWEEDRARHWQYVVQGKYPLYRYYMKFEGMSEEEAKQVVAEAEASKKEEGLFDEE